jgi:hypothetical protein
MTATAGLSFTDVHRRRVGELTAKSVAPTISEQTSIADI